MGNCRPLARMDESRRAYGPAGRPSWDWSADPPASAAHSQLVLGGEEQKVNLHQTEKTLYVVYILRCRQSMGVARCVESWPATSPEKSRDSVEWSALSSSVEHLAITQDTASLAEDLCATHPGRGWTSAKVVEGRRRRSTRTKTDEGSLARCHLEGMVETSMRRVRRLLCLQSSRAQ